MNDQINRLIQRQHEIWGRMQNIQGLAESEKRDWTAEERTNWDAANTDLDAVTGDIERLKTAAKRELVALPSAVPSEPEATPAQRAEQADGDYDLAFRTFMRGGMDGCTREQRQALLEYRASPQGIGVPADGGYLVPPGYRTIMTETMKAYGGLINHANVINTSDGRPLQWPTNDDTGNVGAILTENTAISELGVTIGTRSVGAYTYTSKLVKVSLQLLQDSAFNLDSWLPGKLGERIGRAVADDLVNGTGTGEPTGILPGATTSGVSVSNANFLANTTGLGYDAIIGLEHSVDPAYRAMGNCRFVFNDATLAVIRKFKDADGRPLWQPVPVPGMPSTINGLPYQIDQAMPNIAATARAILFGDFRAGYLVRQALDVQAVRLGERYMDALQVGFFGFMRLDATPDDAAAVRYLTTT